MSSIRLVGRRVLEDGTVVVDDDHILDWILHGRPLDGHLPRSEKAERFVSEISSSGRRPPAFAPDVPDISEHRKRARRFLEPVGDVEELRRRLRERCPDERYRDRFDREWAWMERAGMAAMMPLLADWLERAADNGIVVGLGRGSSCASLVLHLLGLHAVDPVKYDIPFSEFTHEEEETGDK